MRKFNLLHYLSSGKTFDSSLYTQNSLREVIRILGKHTVHYPTSVSS